MELADCLIVSFTGSSPATFLSYPLSYSPSIPSSTPQREVLLSLSTSSTDALPSPSPSFTSSPQHQLFLNPTNAGEECEYVAMMSSKDAGLGRSLVKDMYCNGSWDVFGRLSAIVPHGGTLGCVSSPLYLECLRMVNSFKMRTLSDSTTNTSHSSSLTAKDRSFKDSSDLSTAQESQNSAIEKSILDSSSNPNSSPSDSSFPDSINPSRILPRTSESTIYSDSTSLRKRLYRLGSSSSGK